MSTAQKDDALTIGALALAAISLTTIAHEAAGHGGLCFALGGQVTQLTSVYFHCSAPSGWIAAAGPLANLAWAGVMGLALATLPPRFAALRFVALLSMSFSLFWEAGYLLSAMLLNDGDSLFALQAVFRGEVPVWVRVAGFVAGLTLYVFGLRVVRAAAAPYNTEPGRAARALRIGWIVAAVGAVCAAALYAPDRIDAMQHGLLAVGAASAPLLLIGRSGVAHATAAPPIARSWTTIALSALLYLCFALTLGMGLSR